MNKIYSYVSILLILPCIYLSHLVYKSYDYQKYIISEYNANSYREETTALFNNLNLDYPSLTITALPIKTLVAKYYFFAEDYQKAFELIDQGEKDNPYVELGSSLKAEIFDYLKVYDSLKFYSKKAYEYMPNNSLHFLQYTKALSIEKNIDEMSRIYRENLKYNNPKFAIAFLTGILSNQIKIDDTVKEMARDARKKFITNENVRLAADYILYGEKNIKESIKNSEEATLLFNKGNYSRALYYFKQAAEKNPADYSNFENIGMLLINDKNSQKGINFLKKVIDSMDRPKSNMGKSEYLIGLGYLQLEKKDSACYYLDLSRKLNYKDSFRVHAANCYN